jgi:hypothetical protein
MHDDNTAADSDCSASDSHSDKEGEQEDEPEPEPALVVRISLVPVISTSTHLQLPSVSDATTATTAATKKTRIHLRHLQGQDHVLFESFCGWLKRRMSMPTPTASAGSST